MSQPEKQKVSVEEAEWLLRQQISGVVGRLVKYIEGDSPLEDILGFRCSRRGRVMVTAVRDGGRAAKAGVIAGDELKSIDGWKGFHNCPAHVIHINLKAPVTLIFVGFVGKLQAEVRVKRPAEPGCGWPTNKEIVPAPGSVNGKSWSTVQVCDGVTFQLGSSSLLLATKQRIGQDTPRPGQADLLPEGADTERSDRDGMYELHREDARHVVQRALNLTKPQNLFTI